MNKVKFYGAATIGTKGQLVIPIEARDELNIKEGDKMIILRQPHGDALMIVNSEIVERMLSHAQAEFESLTNSIKSIKESK